MTITYEVGNGLYINLTNRCSNACDFCVRSTVESYYGDLWLENEPTVEQIKESLRSRDLSKYSEIVFCGYGEPTERIDDLLETCKFIRQICALPVRINTNGQGSLINGRDIAPELEGLVDTVSISLNCANATEYQNICHSEFGEQAYDALLEFAKESKKYVKNVILSVVETTIPDEDIEICKKIAQECGVTLRVREFIG